MSSNSPDNNKSTALEERDYSSGEKQLQQSAAPSDALSKWYLARLRRRAHQAGTGGNLTPAALIAADRERVEKLIVENVSDTGIKRSIGTTEIPSSAPEKQTRLILPAVIA